MMNRANINEITFCVCSLVSTNNARTHTHTNTHCEFIFLPGVLYMGNGTEKHEISIYIRLCFPFGKFLPYFCFCFILVLFVSARSQHPVISVYPRAPHRGCVRLSPLLLLYYHPTACNTIYLKKKRANITRARIMYELAKVARARTGQEIATITMHGPFYIGLMKCVCALCYVHVERDLCSATVQDECTKALEKKRRHQMAKLNKTIQNIIRTEIKKNEH